MAGVEGDVVRQRVGRGTKSERDAVVIVTGCSAYPLRRAGANAFDDPELQTFVGHRVRVSGLLVAGQLIADEIEVVTDTS